MVATCMVADIPSDRRGGIGGRERQIINTIVLGWIYPFAKDLVSVARYGRGGGRTSSNIAFLGMQKVHRDLQRLNK